MLILRLYLTQPWGWLCVARFRWRTKNQQPMNQPNQPHLPEKWLLHPKKTIQLFLVSLEFSQLAWNTFLSEKKKKWLSFIVERPTALSASGDECLVCHCERRMRRNLLPFRWQTQPRVTRTNYSDKSLPTWPNTNLNLTKFN